jgi:outer membrane protein assembly factor BamD
MRSLPALLGHPNAAGALRALAVALLASLVVACSSTGPYDETARWDAEELYEEAKTAQEDGIYDKAIKYFERLEARFPFGHYAQQAQIEIAYTHYKAGDTADAVAACDRFLRLFPDHEHADYMYYLKGLASFSGNLGLFANLGGQDPTERDPKGMRDAFDAYKLLLQRFPGSRYAADARQRSAWLVNALASHEIHVARYYLSRTAYVAALNRAQDVIRNYAETPAVENALAVMVAAYDRLGMNDLRDDTLAVMRLNYPASSYYEVSEDYSGPWWARL